MTASRDRTQRGTLGFDDEPGVASLRDALAGAGYSAEGVRAALGIDADNATSARDLPVNLRRLAQESPLSTLIALFLLGQPVAEGDAAAALAPGTLERLGRLGVLATGDGQVRPLVRLIPFGDLVLACDHPEGAADEGAADHVAGVHLPSIALARLAVRRRVDEALDLGTGLGLQALLLARHATRVTAVDLNARALGFARFNALLNGVTNVDFLQGSYFEPVAGRSFDLVLSNPPYVISPETAFLYRDGGLEGDAVSRQVVGEAARHLREGGFAQILISWVHGADEDWWLPLERWVAGSGCDAWLLHYRSDDPLTHSANWLLPLQGDRARHEAALDRWLAYLGGLGIESVAYGAVVLRRRSGAANWVRRNALPPGRLDYAGGHVERVFAGVDHLRALAGEQELLDARLALVEGCRLEQTLVRRGSGWAERETSLVLADGLGFRGGIDRGSAELLARLDGELTLREAIGATARSLGAEQPSGEVVASALGMVAQLLELGFMVLPGGSGAPGSPPGR